MCQREGLQSDFAEGGNVLFLEIDSKWETYLMTSSSVWDAWSLHTFVLFHPTPPLPVLNFLPSYPLANRESYDHILPLGYAIWPLAASQISSHATPPGWLCSRYQGQDLSFLRPFHSVSFPLGTLCARILHIWLLLNFRVSAEHHLTGELILIESSCPSRRSQCCLIFFIGPLITSDNL